MAVIGVHLDPLNQKTVLHVDGRIAEIGPKRLIGPVWQALRICCSIGPPPQ
jgi:hypothetical protein